VDDIIFVGLDVHKATVLVAVAEGSRGGEVRHVGVVANRPDHIGKVVALRPRPSAPHIRATRSEARHYAQSEGLARAA